MENTMNFCLTGYGHLQDVEKRDGVMVARIQVLPLTVDSRDSSPDEITLNCEVNAPEVLNILGRLDEERNSGRQVIVKFVVSYTRLSGCYAGRDARGPEQVILFDGTLVAVEEWFRDGLNTKPRRLAQKKDTSCVSYERRGILCHIKQKRCFNYKPSW